MSDTHYKRLPTYDPEQFDEEQPEQRSFRSLKVFGRTAFAASLSNWFRVVAVMVVAVFSVGLLGRMGAGLRGCGRKGFQGARNVSSLPTYYTLPSGDKIPSVALGEYPPVRC